MIQHRAQRHHHPLAIAQFPCHLVTAAWGRPPSFLYQTSGGKAKRTHHVKKISFILMWATHVLVCVCVCVCVCVIAVSSRVTSRKCARLTHWLTPSHTHAHPPSAHTQAHSTSLRAHTDPMLSSLCSSPCSLCSCVFNIKVSTAHHTHTHTHTHTDTCSVTHTHTHTHRE